RERRREVAAQRVAERERGTRERHRREQRIEVDVLRGERGRDEAHEEQREQGVLSLAKGPRAPAREAEQRAEQHRGGEDADDAEAEALGAEPDAAHRLRRHARERAEAALQAEEDARAVQEEREESRDQHGSELRADERLRARGLDE